MTMVACGDDDGCDGGSDDCGDGDGDDNDGGGDGDGYGDDDDGSDGGWVLTMVVVVVIIMIMVVAVISRYNFSLLSLKSQKRFSSATKLGVRLHSHQKPTKGFRSIPNKRSLLTQNLNMEKTISFSVSNIKNAMLPRQC